MTGKKSTAETTSYSASNSHSNTKYYLAGFATVLVAVLLVGGFVRIDTTYTPSDGSPTWTSSSWVSAAPDSWGTPNQANFIVDSRGNSTLTYYRLWNSTAASTAYVSTNRTDVEQYALWNMPSGMLWLKDVAFNYSLSLSQNQSVVESLNGLQRKFVSSSNTMGSPYTISKDTIQTTYYLAQDSSGAYIHSWSSTVFGTVLNNVVLSNTSIYIKTGDYPLLNGLVISGISNFAISGDTNAHISITSGTVNAPIFTVANCQDISIKNIYLSGAGTNDTQDAIRAWDTNRLKAQNLKIENMGAHGVCLLYNCSGSSVTDNWMYNGGQDGVNVGGGGAGSVTGTIVSRNHVEKFGKDGIHVSDSSERSIVTSNYVYNITEDAISTYSSWGNIIEANQIVLAKRGIVTQYNSNQTQLVQGNLITNTTGDGIYLAYDTSNSSIMGNTLKWIGGYAFHLEGNALSNLIVSGNSVFKASRGIYAYINNSDISHNTFNDISEYGVVLVGGATYGNNTISGNHFSGVISADAIYLTNTHCTISGNTCNSVPGGYSVNEDTGGNFNYITDNNMPKGSSGSYRRTGATTRVTMNIGYFAKGTTAVITGNSIVVSISLRVAPNVILLGSHGNFTAWSDTVSTTSFTIHAPNGEGVSYFAEYIP